MATPKKARKEARRLQKETGQRYTQALAQVQQKGTNVNLRNEVDRLKQLVQIQENRIMELEGKPPFGLGHMPQECEGGMYIWSSCYFDAGQGLAQGTYRLFVTTLGGTRAAPPRTLDLDTLRQMVKELEASPSGVHRSSDTNDISDTNMREGGRIPSGMAFTVQTVTVEIIGGGLGDVHALRNHGVLKADFTQTTVDVCGPLGSFVWDETGRVGHRRIGDTMKVYTKMAQGNHLVRRLFRFGSTEGLRLPGETTFAFLLVFGQNMPVLQSTVKVRVTLGGFYESEVEIG